MDLKTGIIFQQTSERAIEDNGKLRFSQTDNRQERTNGNALCPQKAKTIRKWSRIGKQVSSVEQRGADNAARPKRIIHECCRSRMGREAICPDNLLLPACWLR